MRNELFVNTMRLAKWGKEEVLPLRRFFIFLPIIEGGEERHSSIEEVEEYVTVRFDTYLDISRIKDMGFFAIRFRIFGFGLGFSIQMSY